MRRSSGRMSGTGPARKPRFKRALTLEPGNATALGRSAGLASNLGRFDEALQLGRRAAAQDPLRAAGWHNLGLTAGRAGKSEEAVAALKQALELAPGRGTTHSLLGRTPSGTVASAGGVGRRSSRSHRPSGGCMDWRSPTTRWVGRRKRTRPLPSSLRSFRRMVPTKSPRFTHSAAKPTAPSSGWSGPTFSAMVGSAK